jgi:NADH-quinone oxidoreductase subunit N
MSELSWWAHLWSVLPEIVLVVAAVVTMAADAWLPEGRKRELGYWAIGGLAVALGVTAVQAAQLAGGMAAPYEAFGGSVRADLAAMLFRLIFLLAGILTVAISMDFRPLRQSGEYYTLLLLSILGMGLMGAAINLVTLYLALETVGIALYLLAGYLRDTPRSAEAGLKYFLFGVFSSTIMLYGLALLYGFTGEIAYARIAQALGALPSPAVMAALLLVLVGFGFKVSAVPFHFWTPDVYEGAPTPITAFISVASKAAGFAVLIRAMIEAFPTVQGNWVALISALAFVTMTVGNLLAIPQRNLKRLLAYSSIAQAGYILIGVAAASPLGIAASIFYLGIYTLTNIAAFAVAVIMTNVTGSEEIRDLAGLSRRSPGLALAMLAALLSLGGIPPLVGFFAKLFVFAAAIESGLLWLAIAGVLNAMVAFYYYIMVARAMYVDRSPEEGKPVWISRPARFTLWFTVAGVLLLTVLVYPLYQLAQMAAQAF